VIGPTAPLTTTGPPGPGRGEHREHSSTAPGAERIAAGDEQALEECYRLHGPMVRSYLRRFVTNDEADDLRQTVFMEVWRSRGRVGAGRPFEGWLFGIARKRAIGQLRRRHQQVISIDVARELAGVDGDQFVDRLAWAAEVRSAMTRLSEEQQEAIELSYFGDLSQQQIASRLGVPVGTVKARMGREMRKLAILIGGDPSP